MTGGASWCESTLIRDTNSDTAERPLAAALVLAFTL